MKLPRVALPCALAVSLALAPAAMAKLPNPTVKTIVPGQSVGGVKLGMKAATAKGVWGPGSTCGAAAAGPGSTQCTWSATPNARPDRGARLTLVLVGGKVRSIVVAGGTGAAPVKALHTSKGIGVGSTRAAFQAAYPKATTPNGPANPTLGSGPTVTSFFLTGGRVQSIQVGSPF